MKRIVQNRNFQFFPENSGLVARTRKLSKDVVDDFLKFCEIPDSHDVIE
ncbi:MAG: hypothetical protein QM640_06275 [Niabella sp.]